MKSVHITHPFRSGGLRLTQNKLKYPTNIMEAKQKQLSELTDQELLQEAKKLKSAAIINALLIGFLAGIVIYSIAINKVGFLAIIPLFLAYKLIKNSKYDNKELETLLKARNLK